MKKTLVLDKSVLQGAQGEFIKELGGKFDFLLPGMLLYEIYTKRLEERPQLAQSQKDTLDQGIEANLWKVAEKTGNQWVNELNALRWEAEKGCSAGHMPTERLKTKSIEEMFSNQTMVEQCLEYEKHSEFLAKVCLSQELRNEWKPYLEMDERGFLAEMRKSQSWVAEAAINHVRDISSQEGWKISPNFKPDRQWFSFGWVLAFGLSGGWQVYKHPDGAVPKTKKAANVCFDAYYIACVAIADGLLSADKEMLKLAWACWPEKEDHIYEYDREKKKIIPFKLQC